MRRRVLALCAFACAGLAWGAAPPSGGETKVAPRSAAELFGPTRVWDFHLTVGPREWEAMQPPLDKSSWFGPPPKAAPKGPAGKGPAGKGPPGAFGFDFQYVRADLAVGEKAWKGVALRFKGNSSYMVSAKGLKRPFKIDFNRYVEGQSFLGLKKIALSNNALDPSQAREALSYAVFRAAGVPAARTAFVRLSLTVPGKHDRAFLGLYTLIECVDKPFLKEHFGSGKGLLVKPEGVFGLSYLGEDWPAYEKRYRPKARAEGQARDRQRLIDFIKLVNFADDERFRKEIGAYLDFDAFARYLAANTVMVNLDSFMGLGHNYYLYLNPKTNKFHFLPWDLNHSFGGLTMLGSATQLMDLSVAQPYTGRNRLIERLMEMPQWDRAYRAHIQRLIANGFAPARIQADVRAAEKALAPTVAVEAKVLARRKESLTFGFPFSAFFPPPPALDKFVSKRLESIEGQFAGKRKGHVPTMRFGQPPQARGAALLAKEVVKAAPGDKNARVSQEAFLLAARHLFETCDRDKKGQLDAKALTAGIERLLRPPGMKEPTPKAPPPKGPPGGFVPFGRPAPLLARLIVERADVDRDGKVTAGELARAATKLFAEMDKDRTGWLDEKKLSEGIDRILPSLPWAPAPRVRPAAKAPPLEKKKGGER